MTDPTESTATAGGWTEPGAFEVAPGVHRIPLPLPNDGLRSVNVYAIATTDGLVCVDAGWAIEEARQAFTAALSLIGASPADVRRYLVTHVHRDHYTQGPVLRREHGSTVELGLGDKPTLDLLQVPDRSPLIDQLAQLQAHGAVELAQLMGRFMRAHRVDQDQWESPDVWLTAGPLPLEGGRVLEAVETPGHTAGHLVFHDLDAGIVFTGDHVLPTITPSIGFEPAVTSDPLGAFLRSLRVVRERPDGVMLPAHGPVAPSVHARVDQLIAHHGTRLEQSRSAIEQGATSSFEAAGLLRWTRHEHQVKDLDPFNAMLAVFETGAHLDLLVAQGSLTCTVDDDGIRRYVV